MPPVPPRPVAPPAAARAAAARRATPPRRRRHAPPPPPPPAEPEPAPAPGVRLGEPVGVKLFSAIAGIALVIAAVFFLRYSIEQGWLQPPVRVAIGVLVAVALLVVCELKAARKYPATANAMDAAAIAILFATFFAAHALWNLIPALVAFGLLALVTRARGAAVDPARVALHRRARPARRLRDAGAAVDRREPADPAVRVSAAAQRRAGAGWPTRSGWPVLTWLTLVFTTLYQWGWVFKFLERQQRAAGDGHLPRVPAGGVRRAA